MGGKRVRIQSAHGILIPGGPPRSRAMMWRSKSQTVTYLAAALVLWGLFCGTRNLLRDGAAAAAIIIPLDIPLDFNHGSSSSSSSHSSFVFESVASGEGCPEYGRYAAARHEPTTGGAFDLPFQRPATECRKVVVEEVEEVIREMNRTVKDPDLFRLFENCFPNTLDTSVTWTGVSSESANEEVCTSTIRHCVRMDGCAQLCDLVTSSSWVHPARENVPT